MKYNPMAVGLSLGSLALGGLALGGFAARRAGLLGGRSKAKPTIASARPKKAGRAQRRSGLRAARMSRQAAKRVA